ncbi:MAG: hypothetical protein AAGH15_04795 [Myxococcota bacterium]
MRWTLLSALVLVALGAAPASAQDGEGLDPGGSVEEPDPTRLDVERLPPEAIALDRELFRHGFFVEAHLGARGFSGGVGRLSKPGPHLRIVFGYEILSWLWIAVAAEGSLHETDAPSPPSPTAFEVVGFFGELRFQVNVSARAALWLGGELGVGFATSDVLRTYGLGQADDAGIAYGGQLGFDWHFRNRHTSMGVVSGARIYDGLQGFDGEVAVGIHGDLYLRYVF